MDRWFRKEVSLAKEEAPINIESPLNNTYIEPKEKVEQIEETKPKHEKKKKKEPKKIERPILYKYTVIGCVKNSQGRFRFTDIIEAQDKNIASDIYKQRAKKEFSAVRAINKIEVNEFKDGDQKNIEEIVEELKKSDSIKDSLFTDEELARFILGTILTVNKCKIYKVVYAPSKKKSVIRKAPKLYYMAKNLEEMKCNLESEMKEQLGEYSEKWIQSVSIFEDTSSKEIMTTRIFKIIHKKIKETNQETKETLSDFYDKINNLESITITKDEKEKMLNTLLKIPDIILSSENNDIFMERIKGLEIKNSKKSVELESISNGVLIKDNEHTESILGKNYSLLVEKDKDNNKIVLIKPEIPILMNQNLFKTYTVHSERNGKELIDSCEVVAESEDKASDYIIFICKNEELIKKGDIIKTDILLNNKPLASFVCRI